MASNLKENTLVMTLQEVADIRGGGSLPKGYTVDEGDSSALLVKVGDMNSNGNEQLIVTSRSFLPISRTGQKLIRPGAVVFPKRGGAIATNKKRLLGRPALIDPNLMAVEAKEKIINPEYLYYWFHTIDLTEISNGAIIPQLNRKDLAPLKIPVPNLDEQCRIVARIKECMERVDEIHQLRTQAAMEKSAITAAARHDAFAIEAPVVELSAVILHGPTNGLYKHSKFYGSGIPILRIDAFESGDVLMNPCNLKRLAVEDSELDRFALQQGDIVLNRVNGSLGVLGKACLIDSLNEPTVFESNMMRLRINPNVVNARYILHFLASPNCRDQIKRKAKVIQQSSINQKDVQSILLPLPSLCEQNVIVEHLDNVCRLAADIQLASGRHDEETTALRESILRKAFAGEL